MLRLALGIPAYRRVVDVGHVHQALALGATMHAYRDRVALAGLFYTDRGLVDAARNQLLAEALGANADVLLMCDADTFHGTALEILRMTADLEVREAAVIAAPVRLRGGGVNVYAVEDGKPRQLAAPDGIAPVDRIGTAFMAISCRWVRVHWPEQPWFATRHLPGPMPSVPER